jgi:hypothetical protein
MTTHHPGRKGAGVRTRHEVELTACYRQHRGSKGAPPGGLGRTPLPTDNRQSIREQIEQQAGRLATRRPEEETGE